MNTNNKARGTIAEAPPSVAAEAAQPSPSAADQQGAPPPRLSRRLVALRLVAGFSAAVTTASAMARTVTPAQYTGITDADPTDGPGYGRGGYRSRPYTGVSDGDPYDPPGYGWRRSRPYTGVSDGDPYDPPGYGRGLPRGVTDNDPYDPSGRGRGWR